MEKFRREKEEVERITDLWGTFRETKPAAADTTVIFPGRTLKVLKIVQIVKKKGFKKSTVVTVYSVVFCAILCQNKSRVIFTIQLYL